jgi:molybdate transport system substrate-binding protein
MLTSSAAQAAGLRVLSGNGARAAVSELCAAFERATGHKVIVHFEVNSALRSKIEAGENFDVAVLNPHPLDAVIKQGKIVPETRAVIGRIGLGAGVRAGTPKPDISSAAAFKTALLNIKSVAFPGEGESGIYFAGLVDRLGIAAEMKPKMRPMPARDTVEVVARGEVDLVVVVASRIVGVAGIDYVGLIPADLQTMIGFTAGVSAASKDQEGARALVRFLTAPSAAPVLKRMGIEPFVL